MKLQNTGISCILIILVIISSKMTTPFFFFQVEHVQRRVHMEIVFQQNNAYFPSTTMGRPIMNVQL